MCDVVNWIPKVGVVVDGEENFVKGSVHSSKSSAWQEAELIAERYGSAAAWIGVGRVLALAEAGCHYAGISVPKQPQNTPINDNLPVLTT